MTAADGSCFRRGDTCDEERVLMSDLAPLELSVLRWHCDPDQLGFRISDEVADMDAILGQARALEAVQFGTRIRGEGFNLYVLGPAGVGKRTVVEQCLRQKALHEPVPNDWCYLNNFEDIRRPQALRLPAGRGEKFRKDVEVLVDDLENAIPAALESDEHKGRAKQVEREETERQNEALQALARKALAQHVQLIRTPDGFAMAPLKDGDVLSPDEFHKLPEEDRKRIEQTISALQGELQAIIEQVPKWHKAMRDKIKDIHREAVRLAIGHLIAQAKQSYADLPPVLAYFEAVERNILERIDEFQPAEEGTITLFPNRPAEKPSFDDYEINLLVDHANTSGAPIVHEDHPSYQNLLGRVEHESYMGALTTDFTLIKAGALHRANGGYLILDALKLLQQPYAWEGLKRALTGGTIRLESLGEMLSLISTVNLEPEPIPLETKVVLFGDRYLYYLLYEYDPEFAELFKVAADFDEHFERNPENCRAFAQFVATLARREKYRPLTGGAVARVLEEAVRDADDREKISLRMRNIADLLREAEYWAAGDGSPRVEHQHVEQAVAQRTRRADRLRQRIQEEIRRGTILIATQGQCVGQVNGLSVLDLGNIRFGQPARITATARLGRGEIVDIERIVELGGAIHSKGVLILSSFLAARFASEQPLAVSASLVFEQSYGMVEGDSASVAELVALLSAISGVPIRQDLAVTGSVNQLGQVQPIGGVNEKIEGFFDVCQARGLTGSQGVVIPASNVKHLMLRADVVAAVAAGLFRVYAVEHVDQAASLLTGLAAGERDSAGGFPDGTLNQRVAARLAEFNALRMKFAAELEKQAPCPKPPET